VLTSRLHLYDTPYYCSIATECSEGLDYAPPGGYCVEFEASMKPSREFFEASGVEASFVAAMYQAINGGELYTAIVADNEDTTIRGMGSPGKGIPHDDDGEAPATTDAPMAPTTSEEDNETATSSDEATVDMTGSESGMFDVTDTPTTSKPTTSSDEATVSKPTTSSDEATLDLTGWESGMFDVETSKPTPRPSRNPTRNPSRNPTR